jgi:hypothetical protein
VSITRSDLITLVREYADAVGSQRWSDDLILTVTSSVVDDEWSNLLNAAPYYTFAQRSAVTDAQGRVALSALDHGAGDTAQFWYRIMSVTDNTLQYAQMEYLDAPMLADDVTWSWDRPAFYIAGDYLHIVPRTPNLTLRITVNYKPQRLKLLSGGTVLVPFPAGSEMLLAYESAAQVLIKGGAESQAASVLKAQANDERRNLLDDVRRRTTQPTFMLYPDRRGDWAG